MTDKETALLKFIAQDNTTITVREVTGIIAGCMKGFDIEKPVQHLPIFDEVSADSFHQFAASLMMTLMTTVFVNAGETTEEKMFRNEIVKQAAGNQVKEMNFQFSNNGGDVN